MSARKRSEQTYESNVDYRTPTPGVYRRGSYYRALTRPSGQRKVMHRFETYEEAVAFKQSADVARRKLKQPGAWAVPQRRTRAKDVGYLEHDLCAYCAAAADTIDHIVAVVAGGDDDWTNLTASCRTCNTSKGSKPLLLFLAQTNGCFEWRQDKEKRRQIEADVAVLAGPLGDLLAV